MTALPLWQPGSHTNTYQCSVHNNNNNNNDDDDDDNNDDDDDERISRAPFHVKQAQLC